MHDTHSTFPLMVSVDADQWGYMMRRLHYLEACIVQVLRDKTALKEWWSAAELVAIGLSGLPSTRGAVTRMAGAKQWRRRTVSGHGGRKFEYHFSSFPARAFDDLIGRIVDMLPPDEEEPAGAAPEVLPPPAARRSHGGGTGGGTGSATPPWVLPLLRVVKSDRSITLDGVLYLLQRELPASVPPPSRDEAEKFLLSLGVIAEG